MRMKEISIRHYEPRDEQQVKDLFVAGMMSNTRAAFFHTCRHATNIGLIATLGGLVGWCSGKPLLSIPTIALALGSLYQANREGIRGYCDESLRDDLNQISKVYQERGGLFLVATTDDNNNKSNNGNDKGDSGGRIVGTVGLENKGNNQFELRRMSVDGKCRGQGLGKRLLQRLDEECKPGTKIILGTSSFQYAAHALYQRNGFVITRRSPLIDTGYERYFVNFQLYTMEKQL